MFSTLKSGTRVLILDHPAIMPKQLPGYEGEIVRWIKECNAYTVKMPWLVKRLLCVPEIACPVYNDCEDCGYGAYGSINAGTEKHPEIHHYCAWCLPKRREEVT